MTTLLVIGAVALVLFASIRHLTPRKALPPLATAERGVFGLRRGDVVQHLGADYVVESTIDYEQEGIAWQEHRLMGDGSEGAQWLVVEEDDEVELTLLAEVTDVRVALDAEPPAQMVHQGRLYVQREKGRATATRTRRDGSRESVVSAYWDYAAAEDQVLSIEDWAGAREIFVGRRLAPAALTVLPGSDEA